MFGGINAAALFDGATLTPACPAARQPNSSLPAAGAGSECYDDLHVLDARDSAMTWRQLSRGASASWPQRRAFHTATAIDSRAFLVFGGATAPPKRPRRRSRASSGAAADEGNPVSYLNDVWQFRGEDQAWVCVESRGEPPPARGAHAAALVSAPPRLLVHGGCGEGGAVLDDLWLLSVRQRRGRWEEPVGA